MVAKTLEFFNAIYNALVARFVDVVHYPVTSSHRLFWLYLFASIVFAYGVYYVGSRESDRGPRSLKAFVKFLTPKSVWSHPSAWLDLRFFVVNELTGKFAYLGLLGLTLGAVFHLATGGLNAVDVTVQSMGLTWSGLIISLVFMLVHAALLDFCGFFLHYLQHKIPILWEFHKVHHSPEVMHPLSNFREHPIDNITYGIGFGIVSGLTLALAHNGLGYVPNIPIVFGIPAIFFLFNIGGYHLRHSHIWLRWPGRWSMVFPSSAHHHVHHSCHPDHLDKNFAFIFPVWDVLFRTYHMPETNANVKFGIFGQEESEYTSCLRLYYIPFRNIFAKLRGRLKPAPDRKVKQDRLC